MISRVTRQAMVEQQALDHVEVARASGVPGARSSCGTCCATRSARSSPCAAWSSRACSPAPSSSRRRSGSAASAAARRRHQHPRLPGRPGRPAAHGHRLHGRHHRSSTSCTRCSTRARGKECSRMTLDSRAAAWSPPRHASAGSGRTRLCLGILARRGRRGGARAAARAVRPRPPRPSTRSLRRDRATTGSAPTLGQDLLSRVIVRRPAQPARADRAARAGHRARRHPRHRRRVARRLGRHPARRRHRRHVRLPRAAVRRADHRGVRLRHGHRGDRHGAGLRPDHRQVHPGHRPGGAGAAVRRRLPGAGRGRRRSCAPGTSCPTCGRRWSATSSCCSARA